MDPALLKVADVQSWLRRRSFSETVRTCFQENEIDGIALISLCHEPSELKCLLPVMGDRLRLRHAILEDISSFSLQEEKENALPQRMDETFCPQRSSTPSRDSRPTATQRNSELCDSVDADLASSQEELEDSSHLASKGDSQEELEDTRSGPTPAKKAKSVGCIPDPFPFPDVWPPRIQYAVSSGRIRGTDRLAFIRYMCDFMSGFSSCPTAPEYQRAAKAIVERFPTLADRLRGQPVWTSVKQQLSQRFRNVRSYMKKSELKTSSKSKSLSMAQIDTDSTENGSVQGTSEPQSCTVVNDSVSYKRNVLKIQKEWTSKNPDKKSIKTLMNLTFTARRHWIEKEAKSVTEIMERFPPLKSKPQLVDEFERIVGEDMVYTIIDRWDKLVGIQGHDGKNLKDEVDAFNAFEKAVQPYRTKKGVGASLITWMTNSGELPDLYKGTKEPVIICVEEPYKDGRVISLVSCEGIMIAKLTEMDQFLGKTLAILMATYYVYDIGYPKDHTSILYFLQDVLMKQQEENAKRHTRLRTYTAEVLSEMDKV